MRIAAAIPAVGMPPARRRLPAGLIDRVTGVGGGGPAAWVDTGWGGGVPGLELGAVHEWFAEQPAAALLAGLARRAAEKGGRGGRTAWIGRACWCGAGWHDAGRSVFVDPGSDGERVWAIDAALRCRGVACVVADGSGLDMAASRRLQLAAKAGGVLGLLARPTGEIGALSAARTRWRVTPEPERGSALGSGVCLYPEPRWAVELLRCKGVRPASGARRWAVRVGHETGDVAVVSDAGDRGVEAPRRLA